MSFEDIPEDRAESHPCDCGGNITLGDSELHEGVKAWLCDNCSFHVEINTPKDGEIA